MSTGKLIQMPSNTYRAKLFSVPHGENEFLVAGTLDGFIDLATPNGTYQLSLLEAEGLGAALGMSIADIKDNCLYDLDAHLAK